MAGHPWIGQHSLDGVVCTEVRGSVHDDSLNRDEKSLVETPDTITFCNGNQAIAQS
uniref:Uncharacterized protein n=1 Tax=Ciona savignyi TaxID=51511 RepID=H2YKC5_CIOSA